MWRVPEGACSCEVGAATTEGGSVTLEEWHLRLYGKRPALFTARRDSSCSWCGDRIIPGDDACYWPESYASIAHAGCLHVVWKAAA